MEGGRRQAYMADGPDDLEESCDVLLKLDGGKELPVHSQVLARCMPMFSGMIADGPLPRASAENAVSVPFSECSVEEATHFLSALYSVRSSDFINGDSALFMARLSHKYAVKVHSSQTGLLMHIPPWHPGRILTPMESALQEFGKMCDDVPGEIAGVTTKIPEEFPAYLQVCAVCHALWLRPCIALWQALKSNDSCQTLSCLTVVQKAGSH